MSEEATDCETFKSRVKKLRSLRDKLCTQTTEWASAFELRDYVIGELQDMHLELSKSGSDVTPGWCKERVERILNHMCALPDTTTGENDG